MQEGPSVITMPDMSSDNGVTGFEDGLEVLDSLTQSGKRSLFDATRSKQDPRLVKQGFRSFSAGLLAQDLIRLDDYAGLFGGQAVYHLTKDTNGQFVHASNRENAQAIARRYSRAKYGSVSDIRFFADMVIRVLSQALDDVRSDWRTMFETAKTGGDQVVMMTTGWRNVPSTANVMFDIVVEQVNIKLAYLGLPTIINVKLPRIAPPCENYASLSFEERERVSAAQDHVLPAGNFYSWPGVHVIFGDDVLVTGATADKVYAAALLHGAKSFKAIYPVLLDPLLALNTPATEEILNTTEVTGRLDATFAAVVAENDYVPILRSLRALLDETNRPALASFVTTVPLRSLLKLYVSALNNEFLSDHRCVASLTIIKHHLVMVGVLDEHGYPCRRDA